MATKREGVACYDKAGMDEELFVLRAQDMLAPEVIRYWAHLRSGGSVRGNIIPNIDKSIPKVAEAIACAERMERHPNRRVPD